MTDINLSKLPAPVLVTEKTAEEIYQERLDYLLSQGVDIDNLTASDPVIRNNLAASFRESLVIQNVNDQASAVLLAKATGSNLDHIGNFPLYQTERLENETDDDYQTRILLSPEAASAAAPAGRYELAALTASVLVKGAKFSSPEPLLGDVYILSRENDGTASAELLATVQSRLMSDEVRAQGDVITAVSASIVTYTIDADLVIADGPDTDQVLSAAAQRLQSYVDLQHKLGGQVVKFKVLSALDVEGVEDVNLNGFAEINCSEYQAPYCTLINVIEQP